MYETHFGFNAPPFQLNPDPDFYFDSQGHSKALAYLRYGLQQGEGFIVITGEVGTGKTTLVRSLLQQLNGKEVVAAQIFNTQLGADDLLQSILTAFRVPADGSSKAAMLNRLEAFLTTVAASGRRALLIVDEAQNLSPKALEELRMLSNFQLGSHGLLQSFLVGQPELRPLLQLPKMEQLQQRILASYHLGPLGAQETADYVVHRLRRVGWQGRHLVISADAMRRLHEHTQGVPRRINVLCNRVLLAAYLNETAEVSSALVDEVADELERELNPSSPQPTPQENTGSQPARVASEWPSLARPALPVGEAARGRKYKLPEGALLAVAGDGLAWGQLQQLCRVWAGCADPGEPLVMVHPGAARSDIPAAWRERDAGQPLGACVYLECPAAPEGRRAAALAIRFAELVAEVKPRALLVAGSGFDAVHITLLARQLAVPVIRLAASEPQGSAYDERALTCELLDRSADLLCVPSVAEHQRLLGLGLPSWRVARVSPMTAAVLRASAPAWPVFEEVWAQLKLPAEILNRGSQGFALLSGQVAPGDLAPVDLLQWLTLVRHAHAELPLVWLADPVTADALSEPLIQDQLHGSGLAVAAVNGWRTKWALLVRARCVIAGPGKDLVEEAQVLGVPSVVVQLHGERRSEPMGSRVASVGPSKTQLLTAVRAAVQAPRGLVDPAALDESGVHEVVEQIQRWLARRDALPFQLHGRAAAA